MAAARWLFTKPVEAAALASMGLGAGAVDTAPPDIWPCCAPAVEVFVALQTQWRMGFKGPVGLDYAVLPQMLRLLGHPRNRWRDMFADIQTLEAGALLAMRAD